MEITPNLRNVLLNCCKKVISEQELVLNDPSFQFPLRTCLEQNIEKIWNAWYQSYKDDILAKKGNFVDSQFTRSKSKVILNYIMSSPNLLFILMRGDPRREILKSQSSMNPIHMIKWCSSLTPPEWKNITAPKSVIQLETGELLHVPMWTLGGIAHSLYLSPDEPKIKINGHWYNETLFGGTDDFNIFNQDNDVPVSDSPGVYLFEWCPPFFVGDALYLALTLGDCNLPLSFNLIKEINFQNFPSPSYPNNKRL